MIDNRFTLRPIRTEADYQAALKRVEPCFDTDPEPDSDEGAHFEALIALLMAYEAKHLVMLPADPIEAIKFSMEQQGLTNRDLEPMIGSRGRVSEVLSGKRRLSMAMVWRLHEGLSGFGSGPRRGEFRCQPSPALAPQMSVRMSLSE